MPMSKDIKNDADDQVVVMNFRTCDTCATCAGTRGGGYAPHSRQVPVQLVLLVLHEGGPPVRPALHTQHGGHMPHARRRHKMRIQRLLQPGTSPVAPPMWAADDRVLWPFVCFYTSTVYVASK
eukprot:gene11946-biopygen1872